MNYSKPIVLISIFSCLVNCKQPYIIPVTSSDQSFLVVEGNLSSGQQTVIRLTRTFRLNDTAKLSAEKGALLTVEGKDSAIVRLNEIGNGIYGQTFSLITGQLYRLRIKTKSGKEYLSDYITARGNPPIDSISWRLDNTGVTIYSNTHDPGNSSIYYRWEFDETWEIRSYYYALYKYVNGQILPRTAGEDVSVCWKYANSSNIILASSARLQSDVIHENPLIFIPAVSEKLAVRYSILVRQYTLSKDAYQYFQIMKKNTESLGTIFDSQPSEFSGNIHSVANPGETVIGYLTAAPVQQKRLFISYNELSHWNFQMICNSMTIPDNKDSIAKYVPAFLPFDFSFSLGYFIAEPQCVDCTYRGGSTTKPSFW